MNVNNNKILFNSDDSFLKPIDQVKKDSPKNKLTDQKIESLTVQLKEINLESNNQEKKNYSKNNSTDQEIQKLKKVSFKTPHEDEYSKEWVNPYPYPLDQSPKKLTTQAGGPLVRSKSLKSFKKITDEVTVNRKLEEGKKLLEEGKELFASALNFEMISFLFDKILMESRSRDEIEKCHLLIQPYVKQVLEDFPELSSQKYQNQLKITALFFAYSVLTAKKTKLSAFNILNAIVINLNSDSESLLNLMSNSSNPKLNHLKPTLFHQKMNQYEKLLYLQQIILSTGDLQSYQDRHKWFDQVLGENTRVINKELELDTDIEMRKEEIKFQNPSELLDKGKELFASKPIIDFKLFRFLFTQIVDTSSFIKTTVVSKGGQNVFAKENKYYSFITDYYVQKVREKEGFSELREKKYEDRLKTAALLLAYKQFSFKENYDVDLFSTLYDINELDKSAIRSKENLSKAEKELLADPNYSSKLKNICESTKNQKLYVAQEAWLLAALEWETYIPNRAIEEYFKHKKEKLEKLELEQLRFSC